MKGKYPDLYIDENIHPRIVKSIRELPWKYRVINISNTKLAGQDERDYIHKLRSADSIFITADREFIRELRDYKKKSSAIILLPAEDVSEAQAEVVAMLGRVQFYIDKNGVKSVRDTIFHTIHDGIHIIHEGKDYLDYSYNAAIRDIEEFLSKELGKDVRLYDD